MIEQFHFLRPDWLWCLLPAALLLALLWRQSRNNSGWSQIIDADLLQHLVDRQVSPASRTPMVALALVWMIAAIALAGPAWKQIPQPVQQKQDALVLIQDLSLSMLATDQQPSRLIRSRLKLTDLLTRRKEGTTALVAYAGDAHIVSPLTDDVRTIGNLLPALSPSMMPRPGSEPVPAVILALELLRAAGAGTGHLLLVSDGISERDRIQITELMTSTPFTLSVLGIGTAEGSPIPRTDGSFLKDPGGQIVIPTLDEGPLRELAQASGGQYSPVRLDDVDLDRVLTVSSGLTGDNDWLEGRTVDTWEDAGFWLLLLILLPGMLAFRRGWILSLALLLAVPEPALASPWQDAWSILWQTPDQRAQTLLEQGDAEAAAQTFKDPQWRAAAHYRAQDYETASESYATGDSADHWYNQGNALARNGDLDGAIAAYDEALQRQPDMEDAQFNRDLLEQLKQQQEQQQQDNSDQSEQDQSEQDQSEQDQSEQDQSEQNSQDSDASQDPQQNPQQNGSDSSSDPSENQRDEAEPESESEQEQQQPEKPSADDTQQQPEADEKPPEQQQGRPEDKDAEAKPEAPQPSAETADGEPREPDDEQWLRRIPDDPSGLLRRKFQYESQQRQDEAQQNNDTLW